MIEGEPGRSAKGKLNISEQKFLQQALLSHGTHCPVMKVYMSHNKKHKHLDLFSKMKMLDLD